MTRAHAAVATIASVVMCAGCGAHHPRAVAPTPTAGISLALYADGNRHYGVVDDRRWLDLAGSSVLLDNIDPGAALASLVIEPADPRVHIGPCARDRLPDPTPDGAGDDTQDALDAYGAEQERIASERLRLRIRRPLPNVPPAPEPEPRAVSPYVPIVRCATSGAIGRQLVRIVYVSTTLAYKAQHDIEVHDATHATIDTRYAVATPPWRTRATVALFDGIPGGERVPTELAHGTISLDGGTSVVVIPSRDVTTHLRRIYADLHTSQDTDEPDAPEWSPDMVNAVWATLELPGVDLSPGNIHVHVALPDEQPRWIDIAASQRPRKDDHGPLRIPLWIDDSLRAMRQRNVVDNDGIRMVEVFTLAVSNTGDTSREVMIEERLLKAKRRRVEHPWPNKPRASGDVLRSVVEIKPGKNERLGYIVVYDL